MQLAVCGSGGDPNCYGTNTTIGGRKTARRKTARRKTARRSRRGGARRSRRRGVRGGRQNNMGFSQMPVHQMPWVRQYRGGGNASEFLPAVCGEGGLDC